MVNIITTIILYEARAEAEEKFEGPNNSTMDRKFLRLLDNT
jgi:hypothetical protein